MKLKVPLLALAVFSITGATSHAAITFSVTFTTQADSNLTTEEKDYFTGGLQFWDDVIIGYRDGVSRSYVLEVDTFDEPADMGLITLGSAGPSGLAFSQVVADAATSNQRFILATGGSARFNTNPDAGPLNPLTIRHEIGHALGIGTLWEDNEVYNDGISNNSNRTATVGAPGEYFGASALAAYKSEFTPSATFIPVELDGGTGTAHGHWNESADLQPGETDGFADTDPGDAGPAPVVLSGANAGESQDDELMTGRLSGSGYLSNTTVQSLYDIGFSVATPVPEPRSTLVLLSLLGFMALRRRR